MKTAIVVGATGYTGREIVRVLAERGVNAVAHIRPDSPRLDDYRARFEAMGATCDTTAWDEPALTAMLLERKPAQVFACLGTTKKRGQAAEKLGSIETYETIDYGLTAMLIRALVRARSDARFIYLSSLGVNDTSLNAYVRARRRVEKELEASGLPYTIIRPSFISGEDRDEDRPLERVGARAASAVLCLTRALGARRVSDRFGPMTGAELARAMVLLAEDPGSEGGAFESDALRALLRQDATDSPNNH